MLWFLKGPAWCLWGKTETGMAQLGAVDTEWVGCYCTARLPSAWTDMVVYVCELHALKQDSEVIGFFQPWGGKSENVWKGGGERREESRVEQKACLVSAGENGVHEGGWRETEEQKKKKTPSISLEVCTATGHSIYCWYMCSIYVSSCTSTCNFASAHRGF